MNDDVYAGLTIGALLMIMLTLAVLMGGCKSGAMSVGLPGFGELSTSGSARDEIEKRATVTITTTGGQKVTIKNLTIDGKDEPKPEEPPDEQEEEEDADAGND